MPDRHSPKIRHTHLFGHPKGLTVLFATEMWERFSYFGMASLLVLYLVKYLLLPGNVENVIGLEWLRSHFYAGLEGQPLASAVFGTYTSLVYATPILGGIIAVEKIFNYNGMGQTMLFAAQRKDIPMLTAGVIVIGIVYMVATLIADMTIAWMNPRIRLDASQ